MREKLDDYRIIIKRIIPEYIPQLFQAAFESREELKVCPALTIVYSFVLFQCFLY